MTDYKNKYIKYKIKYLNLIGGIPSIEIDLISCTKFSHFQEKKDYTKEDLEKYNFDLCVNKITDKYLKVICKILFNLVSQIHDLVIFLNIFKSNQKLANLQESISNMFKSFNFKFDLSNLLVFLYNFIDFLKKFIESINELFKKIYENIVTLNITDRYFLLHLQDNRSVSEININIFIRIFKECYETIFKLILDLKNNFQTEYANKKVLFDNFNIKFKNNMVTLYSSTKNVFNIPFIEYEKNLRNQISNICKKIESQLKGTQCNDFFNGIKELQDLKNNINKELVNKFLLLMENFNCIKDKRTDIFNNLKEIGVILKFLSTPEEQKKIEEKLKTVYDLFSTIQKTLFVKDVNTDYTSDLLKKLDLLKEKLSLCLNQNHEIYKNFIEFKDTLHPTNISEENINKLSIFYKKLKEFIKSKNKCVQSNIKKTELEKVAIDIRKILEKYRIDKPQQEKSIFSRLLGRKKYKIINLKLIGGVFYADINLKSCSKLSFFTEKKLMNNFQFNHDTFTTKKTILESHNIETCFKKEINNINFNQMFKEICITLLNLVSELNDFVEFIEIFNNSPFNEDFKVKEIISNFNSFNFVLELHKLPNFLQNFYIFFKDFVEKINILFRDVLSKNKNIFELDFMKYKYFALSLGDFSIFHNQTFVKCPIFFKVFRDRYDKIFDLIKKLTNDLTDTIVEILVNDFQLNRDIDSLYSSSIDIFKKTIITNEKKLRVGISPICDKILKLVILPLGCEFNIKLINLSIDSKNKYNEEIIKQFLDILDTFSCIKEKRAEILYEFKNIGTILKELATKEEIEKIEKKMKELGSNLTVSEKISTKLKKLSSSKSKIIELNNKLEELEKNLLLCFNGQGDIFDKFINFKNKIQKTNINEENINELDEINKLLEIFIKDKEGKCKKKINIKKKEELNTQLLSIRNILQENKIS